MIKPDVIVSWPKNSDYPLWRQFIRDNRNRFAQVVVVFTETHDGRDYSAFVKKSMAGQAITFVDSPIVGSGQDWRDVAVKEGLKFANTSEWIWFTEQDFYPKPGFFEEIFENPAEMLTEVFAAYQGERMHPCSILIRRKTLAETKMNFGIDPGRLDHFGLIQEDIYRINAVIQPIHPDLYHHYNGLSHNFRLICDGQPPVYQPAEFFYYLRESLDADVPLDPDFVEIAKKWVKKM